MRRFEFDVERFEYPHWQALDIKDRLNTRGQEGWEPCLTWDVARDTMTGQPVRFIMLKREIAVTSGG